MNSSEPTRFLCRTFGDCQAGDPLDREVGDVIGKGIPSVPKLFTYARYNTELSRDALNELGLSNIEPEHVQQMDSVDFIDEMREVGRALASRKANAERFAGFPA